jgi:GNAT superfamily N-acetyltransferase
VIREASIDDATGATELFRAVTPEFVSSPAGTRHFMTTSPPAAKRRWWCAEDDGTIVGWVSVGLVVDTSEEGVVWIAVLVDAAHRGRGIGAALAERAEDHARSIGGHKMLCWSRGDDVSAAFARSRGFVQTATHDILAVDPRTVEPPDPPSGIELLPFAAFEDDPSPIHHVDTVSVLDEPGELSIDELPFERWIENYWSHPLLDRDASFVATVEGVAATVTWIQTDRESGAGSNNGTGTIPELRGRGLATLAKRASLARAAALGITRVYTGNDVTNAPMLAINRRLGYRPCATELHWAKDLTISPSG